MAGKNAKTYTVSQVTSLIRVAIENNLPSRLLVVGQISDFKHHSSGHCYFSLKDENSVLGCVMWASKFKNVKFSPENGMEVLAKGHIDIYPPQGKYQFYVDKLDPGGVGALQLAFEQMVKRLEAEGLFKDEHKKAIPPYPMRIGLVTSQSGAAVADIAESIYNRWPCAKLFLFSVPVQGEGAAEKIATTIRNTNKSNKKLGLDVLIVGRGGGSLEDLWAFNEEVLARAIFDSSVPVISAIGHEVDTTIADLVADARASTPTKAGVIAVPEMEEVLDRIATAQKQLSMSMETKLELCCRRVQTVEASSAFKDPYRIVNQAIQRTDEMATKLAASAGSLFAVLREALGRAYEKVLRIEPARLLEQKKLRLNNLDNSAEAAMKDVLTQGKLRLTAAENRLAALNPKSVLSRGYSITTNSKTGRIVVKVDDVEIGDMLITELANRNLIESQVRKK